MRRRNHNSGRKAHCRPARMGTAFGMLLSLCLLLAAPAAASFESVGAFGNTSSWKVHEPQGLAVNYTGAGGVPVGTVYVGNTQGSDGGTVQSYDAKGNFRQACIFMKDKNI